MYTYLNIRSKLWLHVCSKWFHQDVAFQVIMNQQRFLQCTDITHRMIGANWENKYKKKDRKQKTKRLTSVPAFCQWMDGGGLPTASHWKRTISLTCTVLSRGARMKSGTAVKKKTCMYINRPTCMIKIVFLTSSYKIEPFLPIGSTF